MKIAAREATSQLCAEHSRGSSTLPPCCCTQTATYRPQQRSSAVLPAFFAQTVISISSSGKGRITLKDSPAWNVPIPSFQAPKGLIRLTKQLLGQRVLVFIFRAWNSIFFRQPGINTFPNTNWKILRDKNLPQAYPDLVILCD